MAADHIQPHVHECGAFLWFTDNGLSPYWTIRNLLIQKLDGHGKVTTEIGDQTWVAELTYSDSGIAPRESDAVERDVLRDFELRLGGPEEAKAHFGISARFDDMRKSNGEKASIPWCGGEGLDVQVQSSNIALDALPVLLRKGLNALANDVGMSINQRYFRRPLPESKITTLEYYIRYKRAYARKVVRSDGILYRLMLLLADEKGTKWEYKANNEDVIGYNHRLVLEPSAVEQLVPDHSTGVRLKNYHPKFARSEETDDDALSSPKLGCAFHRKIDGETRDWSDRDELRRQLEELLVNVLRWADVPTDPDPTCYVPDDHFDVVASDREIAGFADPTPKLEAEQECLLMSVLGELTPTAKEATEVLATDGGRMHYTDLADETDSSISTIYRILDRFGELVESDRGMVKFTSEKIRQEIVGLVEHLDEMTESTAERVAELANVDLRSRADSALEKWMAKYGADLAEMDTDELSGTLRFDVLLSVFRADDHPFIESVLEEGLEAWTSTGRDALLFKELRIEADVRGDDDGQRVGSIIGW